MQSTSICSYLKTCSYFKIICKKIPLEYDMSRFSVRIYYYNTSNTYNMHINIHLNVNPGLVVILSNGSLLLLAIEWFSIIRRQWYGRVQESIVPWCRLCEKTKWNVSFGCWNAREWIADNLNLFVVRISLSAFHFLCK